MVGIMMCVVGLYACSCCNTGARYEGFPRLSLLGLKCLPDFGAITPLLSYSHLDRQTFHHIDKRGATLSGEAGLKDANF